MFIKQAILIVIMLFPLFYLVYRIRGKNLFDLSIYVLMILGYLLIYRDFVFGRQFSFHDTFWTYHVFYSVIDQWLRNGFSIGWNPFMNGGEPLYIYSNFFLWAEFILFSLINRVINLPADALINLYLFFIFVSFFTFSFILFSAVLKERFTVFFAGSILIFSGFTYSNLGQPSFAPLYLFPLIFLAMWEFFQKRRRIYLFYVIFLMSISANHYLPQYLAIFILFFTAAWLFAGRLSPDPEKEVSQPQESRKNLQRPSWGKPFFILLISLIVLLPAAYVFLQLQRDYISPTRGGGKIEDMNRISLQVPVSQSPDKYKYLFTIPQVDPNDHLPGNLAYQHSIYYLGAIPVIFFFLFLFYLKMIPDKKRFLLCCLLTLLLLAYTALGTGSLLWDFLVANIPLCFLRHSFPLAHLIGFMLILLATAGFSLTLRNNRVKLLVILANLAVAVFIISKVSRYDNKEDFKLASFSYPVKRSLYSRTLMPIPFDTTSLIQKEASATHPSENYIFFRNEVYNRLLKENPGSVIGNIFMFSKDPDLETLNDASVEYVINNNPNHLRIRAISSEDGYLIRRENFNRGWKARVNNSDALINKFKGVFQAVKIKKGGNIVDFTFSSPYPVLFWLHIICVMLGYCIFFRDVIKDESI